MAGVTMSTDVLRQVGDLQSAQGAITQTAGTVDQVATITAATPVFGPIAAQFLAAFAAAQANHGAAVAQLTNVYENAAAAANAGAAGYDLTEADSATELAARGLGLSTTSVSSAAQSGELETAASELLQMAGQGAGAAGQLVAIGQTVSRDVEAAQQQAALTGPPGASAPADPAQPPTSIAGSPSALVPSTEQRSSTATESDGTPTA